MYIRYYCIKCIVLLADNDIEIAVCSRIVYKCFDDKFSSFVVFIFYFFHCKKKKIIYF